MNSADRSDKAQWNRHTVCRHPNPTHLPLHLPAPKVPLKKSRRSTCPGSPAASSRPDVYRCRICSRRTRKARIRHGPETGETYETVLGNGIYRIGVHVPEGIYRAELSEGTGSIQIKDEENGIYHYVTFGTDTEYDQVTEEEDIRLYNGADLLVDSGVILRFVTENAQPPVQEIQENPLKEPVSLEAGNYTAGSDMTPQIPQGIYDITALDTLTDEYGYSSVTLTYPNGSSEYLWIDSSDYAPVTDEYTDISAKNIVITDGTEITVEYGSVTLMPGKGYYDVDYTQYTSE